MGMSKMIHLLPLWLLASTVVHSQPVDSCDLEARDTDDVTDICSGAINCETYIDEDGFPIAKFKEGMEPGSDWYNENVAPLDPWIDESYPGYQNVTKRDVPLERRDANHKSTVNRSKQRIIWGNAEPYSTMHDGVMNHCLSNDCDSITWSKNIDYVKTQTRQGGTLHFKGIGHWPNNKGYYADALGHIVKKLHRTSSKTYTTCVNSSPTHPPTCTTHKGFVQAATGNYVAILRFVKLNNGALADAGHLTVTVKMTTDGDDACSYILNGLTSLMSSTGAIGTIGAGYFGALNKKICSQN